MKKKNNYKIYSNNHGSLFDKLTINNRIKMLRIINQFLSDKKLIDILDVGTTNDRINKSSNFLIKNLKNFKIYKTISNQKIEINFFSNKLKKSITSNLNESEIKNFKSDLVISNATIEHVGDLNNQIKMCKNIIKLSKKFFIIITPNRYHPLEFHTKLPLIHWLPKAFHRKTLNFFGMIFLSKEDNLNLLSEKDLILIMKKLNHKKFIIKSINFLFFKSNLILIGKKK